MRRGRVEPAVSPAIRARAILAPLAVALLATACGGREPRVAVRDLSWACGDRRCTAAFRLASEGAGDETLLVRVRGYAGDTVASREVVGEHRERVAVPSGQSRSLRVAFETRRPASRLRVLLERTD